MIGVPLLVAGAATEAQTLASLPNGSKVVERPGTAKPVIAWVKFCDQFPVECAVDTSEPAVITLNRDVWNTLVAVNRSVNRRIKPVTDKEHWGVVDRWEFPDDGMGDCEDFQLLKRKLLVEKGLPRRAMRMTVVIDELGEGHAVLMVRTDRGDFILDNKLQSVLPWEQTGYVFVKREGHDSTAWVSLGGLTSPVTTANR
jgi:predicted transglutaminase-like cysteine proteinase